MYRPNRIGTPFVHTQAKITSTANWTPTEQPDASSTWSANVINATPVSNWGRTVLQWAGSEAITGARRIGLAQQITIAPPITTRFQSSSGKKRHGKS